MKNKIIYKIKKISAQNQIVSVYVLFMFLSMTIIGTYLSFVLYTKSLEATNEKMTIYVDKTKENIEQMFSLVSNTAHAVAASNTILKWIDTPYILNDRGTDYYSHVNKMEQEIRYVLNYSSAWKADLISYISVYVNDDLISYTYAKPIPEKLIVMRSNNAYEHVNEFSGSQYIPPFIYDKQMYYALKLKYDFRSDKSLVILIATDEEVLKKQYGGAIPAEDTKTYLVDDKGIIFSSSMEESPTGEKCAEAIMNNITYDNITNLKYNNKKYVAIARKVGDTHLNFINLVPKSYITKQAFKEFPLFINLALTLTALLLIIGILISKKITRFIKDLTYAMNSVKNANYDVKMPFYNNDAVDSLSNTFNSMTSEMKHLIQTTYESKIMLQEMEFKSLQQQTNPHFLFNILLVIQIKAKMSSDETVYNMLTSLSGLLRGSLYSNKNIYTTLEEELKYVNFYLYLQQQRFKEKLHYEINMDDSLQKVNIPRLTIEPIVENAVIHGVENNQTAVNVIVNVFEKDDDIIIEVIDDGIGFDVGSVDFTSNSIKDGDTREKIGLSNTHNRLKLLYGDNCGLEIMSQKNKGTKVIIRIRKQK